MGRRGVMKRLMSIKGSTKLQLSGANRKGSQDSSSPGVLAAAEEALSSDQAAALQNATEKGAAVTLVKEVSKSNSNQKKSEVASNAKANGLVKTEAPTLSIGVVPKGDMVESTLSDAKERPSNGSPGRKVQMEGKDERKRTAAGEHSQTEAVVEEKKAAEHSPQTAQPVAKGTDETVASAKDAVQPKGGDGQNGANEKKDSKPKRELEESITPLPRRRSRQSSLPTAGTLERSSSRNQIFDDVAAYNSIPLIELTQLPRGGVSMETQAVGHVQFGIPPETIKDSMRLGLGVPNVYIVPVERFSREMGPALGVNLAEFEFPAYFNFFVQRRRCTLIVDSEDAERNIRRVFSETLLGPAQFRRSKDPIPYEEEDFAPEFPRDAIPDFQKELKHFRIMPNGEELVLETLLKFCHFEMPKESGAHEDLGVPPPCEHNESDIDESDDRDSLHISMHGVERSKSERKLRNSYSSPSLPALAAASDSGQEKQNAAISTKTTAAADVQRTAAEVPGEDTNLAATTMQEDIDNDIDEVDPKLWTYSQAKWIGDVARVYPSDATEEQIAARTTKRVEIFKMPGGTEYILHDIDENNIIVGKARFSGHVRVSEGMSVDGFGGRSIMDDVHESKEGEVKTIPEEDSTRPSTIIPKRVLPPTFHPPSFGVTVLGNSHGFDKSGSVSGYVLWINGRGVMIDPPPYSSATLEREGIRPRTIVGIILTHCHADHDAGAFQKVLTGSPVVVITTPTIYKSFIRKYAALSALSPALLRHSHRYKPALIGAPLRFQGATFHFTYTLHTIPCVGFRVEWRGRSMVFTGDHFNSPPAIDKLQEQGVLSTARADDLRNLPLQETDLLLHEAGAPPIHTPLDVLLKLPANVKRRLYVVHTSALPEGCELRVAPTGTAGTIRLDQMNKEKETGSRSTLRGNGPFDDGGILPPILDEREYAGYEAFNDSNTSLDRSERFLHREPGRHAQGGLARMNSLVSVREPPLVSLRPTSSSDAWFTLNLLSAVPFLSSLSYSSTMEVLETARVEAFCINDIVVPAHRRRDLLCVVWEGTCMEREKITQKRGGARHVSNNARRTSTFDLMHGSHKPLTEKDIKNKIRVGAVWHAGDWTGPRALQPEKRLSGQNSSSETHDIVAMSSEGVKVITVEFSNLHTILKSGSALYRKYLARRCEQDATSSLPLTVEGVSESAGANTFFEDAIRKLNVIELLDVNSGLRKLSAVQKRHLESIAEGPVFFGPGQRLWRSGADVDKAFIVVAGTVSFVPKRRNAGSCAISSYTEVTRGLEHMNSNASLVQDDEYGAVGSHKKLSIGESMRLDAMKAIRELNLQKQSAQPMADDERSQSSMSTDASETHARDTKNPDPAIRRGSNDSIKGGSLTDTHDYARLSRGLQKRADHMNSGASNRKEKRDSSSTEASLDPSIHDFCDSVQSSLDLRGDHNVDQKLVRHSDKPSSPSAVGPSPAINKHVESQTAPGKVEKKRRSSKDRFANKVLGRLYSRRAFTAGLVFSRGHFLGDVSKMVAGLLAANYEGDDAPAYGFGDKSEGKDQNSQTSPVGELTIHEQEGAQHTVHSSTLAAGKNGCVVLVFPKSSLIPFLDEYPGLLLSLLGTQVVV